MTEPLRAGGHRCRKRRSAPENADQLLGDHREAKGHQQAQDRIGCVETAKNEFFEQNAEHGHGDRRQHDRRTEAEIFCDFDRCIGAERVERAMRQVHDAADAEDQRQTERDQQVVASEHEAVDYLFEQEHELNSRAMDAEEGAGVIPLAVTTRSPGAGANAPRAAAAYYKVQGFCSLVGLMTSSGSFAAGMADPSVMRSHLSLAWPLVLSVNG